MRRKSYQWARLVVIPESKAAAVCGIAEAEVVG